jgi:hypothetical protein
MSDNESLNNSTLILDNASFTNDNSESVDPSPPASKFIDNDLFIRLLQDKGEDANGASAPNGAYSDGTRFYKELYQLSKLLLDNLSSGGFINPPKNMTQCRRGMARWMLARRAWKVSPNDHTNNNGVLPAARFHLAQEEVIDFMLLRWPPPEGQSRSQPTANDKIRLVGILLSEEYSLDYDIILGNYFATGNRADIDNPAMRTKEAWARIAFGFSNNNYTVSNPRMWETAMDKPGFDDLNPNDQSCFTIGRDGKWLTTLYKDIMSDYRVSFEKYSKGTGGGPGDPADYSDWERRPDVTFDRYSNGKLYLTWMYMRDKEVGFKLCAKYEDIPEGLDGDEHTTLSSAQESTTSKRRAKSPVAGFQESLKDMTTALQAVAAKFLNEGESEDKTLDQLEKLQRLRRSYQELPENTEDERRAKRRRLEYLAKMEERLLME